MSKKNQINTLEQLKNIQNYSFLKDKLEKNALRGYALWLDLQHSDAYIFSYSEKQFVKIDEESYERLYKECEIPNIDQSLMNKFIN